MIKRSFCAVAIIIAVLTAFSFSACIKTAKENPLKNYDGGFTVTYIDVGEGDSIYFNFPNGKTMLIDTGKASETNLRRILGYSGSSLDYLIITNVNTDHLGNSVEVLKNVTVRNAFVPKVVYSEYYPIYEQIIDKLNSMGAVVKYSDNTVSFSEGGVNVYFLSPDKSGIVDSAIDDFNLAENPTEKQKNNISPIIFMEYNGVKFMFESDADSSQEQVAIHKARYFGEGITLQSISDVDFLKVAHHGANDGTSEDFLSVVKPKNAIISVGAENTYSHPSARVIQRLTDTNSDINIYRTDVYGSIRVNVSASGTISMCTTKN